jgi:hypothetical protein
VPYKSNDPYPGGFTEILSLDVLPGFVTLHIASMAARDEYHGGMPVCQVTQPDGCCTLEVLRHELPGARETKHLKVPPNLMGAKALPDLTKWAKSLILGAHGLPNGSIPSYVPEALIVRLPRCWYKDTTSRVGSVLFMPHFVAFTEQSEKHRVVRKIEGCLTRYLRSARTMNAVFIVSYPEHQDSLLDVIGAAMNNILSDSEGSRSSRYRYVVSLFKLPSRDNS